MIEFSLVVGLALAVIVGLIAASFLFFQKAAMHDGSTAGARMASMQTSLQTYDTIVTGKYCESQVPMSIEAAVAQAAPQVAVNMLPLCSSTQNGTTLVQTSPDSSKVTIQVDASNGLGSPANGNITVTITFNGQGLGPPLNKLITFNSSTSTVPVRAP